MIKKGGADLPNKYCIYKRVIDNIPGFRDSEDFLVRCFDNQLEAQELMDDLNQKEAGSVYHEGYGAGSGSIYTTFFIVEE